MAKQRIVMAGPPAIPRPARLMIARAPNNLGSDQIRKATFMVNDNAFLGLHVHWVTSHSYPCMAGDQPCPYCEEGNEPIWKGYAVGYEIYKRTWHLIEITQEAVWSEPLLWDPNVNLRGARLELWRRGKASNSPVQAKVMLDAFHDATSPPFDCLENLIRVWFSRYRQVTERQIQALRLASLTTAPPLAGGAAEKDGDA